MKSVFIYGIVVNGIFYSNQAKIPVENISNGFYSIDITADNYAQTIQPADMFKFEKYIKKSDKMKFLYGYSFHDCFVPLHPSKYKTIPIKVIDNVANEWEYIKVVYIKNADIYYYYGNEYDTFQLKIWQVQDAFTNNKSIKDLKHTTPEIRAVYSLHSFERIQKELEVKRLIEEEYRKTTEGRIKSAIEDSGAKFISMTLKPNRGYEVFWECQREIINSFINFDLGVIEAGFCLSGHDKEHTIGSIVNLLQDYKEGDGDIYKTRI